MIQEQGVDSVEKRIGVDATGARFNSMIAVEAVKTTDTNQRNQAIGALMLAYGYIKDNWQQAVDL